MWQCSSSALPHQSSHCKKRTSKCWLFWERARCTTISHDMKLLVSKLSLSLSCTLHAAAPLTPEGAAYARPLLKPQPLAPASRVHQRTLRFLTLTRTAYRACPNYSRLTPQKLENPTKELGRKTGLTLLSLLEGFSARCCDCAGWWSYRNKKLLSFSLLEVSNERKTYRTRKKRKEKLINEVKGANEILAEAGGWGGVTTKKMKSNRRKGERQLVNKRRRERERWAIGLMRELSW